jgi:hypothetical protein
VAASDDSPAPALANFIMAMTTMMKPEPAGVLLRVGMEIAVLDELSYHFAQTRGIFDKEPGRPETTVLTSIAQILFVKTKSRAHLDAAPVFKIRKSFTV